MTRVFISYRRDDSAAYAGRLYDRLTAHFGQGQVFMDIDQIEPGEDFVEAIQRTVSACETAVVLIGKGWLNAADAEGTRRLDDPDDFVRLEVTAALERKIKVVPVLVGGAYMPKTPQLPTPLAPLARRNAIEISDTRFHTDVNRLIEAIEKSLAFAQPPAASAEQLNRGQTPPNGLVAPASETVNVSSGAPNSRASSPEPAAQREIPPPDSGPRPLEPSAEVESPADQYLRTKKSETKRKRVFGFIGAAFAVVTLVLMYIYKPPEPQREPDQQAAAIGESNLTGMATVPAYTGAAVKLRVQDTYASGDQRSGALRAFAKALGDESSARIQFEVLASGSIFPSWGSLDAVARGTTDAAWVSASYFYGKNPAFALIDEPPFGPNPARYVQWRQDPRVRASVEDIYRKFGVNGLMCGTTGPNADLWSRKRIDRASDLKGLKTRAVGVKLDILTEAGVAVSALPTGEIYPALNRGVLDAIQLSDLPLGVALGIPNITKHLYFPGGLSAASGVDLIINAGVWDGLAAEAKAVIEKACRDMARAMVQTSESENRLALASIAEKGVTVEALPAAVQAELQKAWMKVANDKSADPLFSKLFALTRSPTKGQ